MKSIKPGRGPSALTGIMGIFMIGFGIVWTVLASRINLYAAFFGILWTGMAVAVTIYNLKNATGKNRYSAFDKSRMTQTKYGRPKTDSVHTAEFRSERNSDIAIAAGKSCRKVGTETPHQSRYLIATRRCSRSCIRQPSLSPETKSAVINSFSGGKN